MKRAAVIALLCAFGAFVAADVVSRDVFERLPHLEDEFAYLYQARIFARGETHIASPQPRRAFWQPFLLDVNGHRFAKYPPGWPLLLAPAAGMGLPWIANAWLALLTVALVYRLGRALFDPATGALAALLTAASPAALLLDGSLMGHTAGLCCATLFLLALWHLVRPAVRSGARSAARTATAGWALAGGLGLGLLLINRPLTAVGAAVPLALVFAGRLGGIVRRRAGWRAAGRALLPLLTLAAVALSIGLLWPAFNYRVSAPRGESFPAYLGRFLAGDDDTNLYLRVWPYDRVGFGPGHGRAPEGHTLARGWEHTRADLACAARDLFGWAAPAAANVDLAIHDCAATGPGWSWLPLALGTVLAARRCWTWLLLSVPAGLVTVYVAYWIGGSSYSARYYFEGLTAAALVSAAGITSLGRGLRRWSRRRFGARAGWLPLAVTLALTVYALAIYVPARLRPLRGLGGIRAAQLQQVEGLRADPDRPVMVVVRGDYPWRQVGALMAVTTPHLDSDLILARDPDRRLLSVLLGRFPDREVLFFVNGELFAPPDEW